MPPENETAQPAQEKPCASSPRRPKTFSLEAPGRRCSHQNVPCTGAEEEEEEEEDDGAGLAEPPAACGPAGGLARHLTTCSATFLAAARMQLGHTLQPRLSCCAVCLARCQLESARRPQHGHAVFPELAASAPRWRTIWCFLPASKRDASVPPTNTAPQP